MTTLHKTRERNRKLVNKKKKQVLDRDGALKCECCGFDFEKIYGSEFGGGFAECHHRKPIAEADFEREITQDELAIVCSNCHSIIHRSKPMLTVEALHNHLITTGKYPIGG